MKTKLTFALLFAISFLLAQEKEKDSILSITLNEIILLGKTKQLNEKQAKPLASIDEYLQKSGQIDMIKRGSYAWEPMLNSMTTERTLVTIDGMRIFGACTDKMDPITSYVEISNLEEATIATGQQSNCHGNTIGGSIDLKRKSGFSNKLGWMGQLMSGLEWNNKQRVLSGIMQYNDTNYYVDASITHRKSENFQAGGGIEILYSQFEKINTSLIGGFRFQKNKLLEASVIFDEANDVGYPALPMDVSLARAWITSLKFEVIPTSNLINQWESKLYFNSVTHYMDDSKRPFVPIRMDMPGWSTTYGFYSKIKATIKNHEFLVNWNGFYNKSVAEMTMYPNNPNENKMFMLTWPDVRTLYNGLYIEDIIALSCHQTLKINGSLGFHQNQIADIFGLQSLQIFYPNMKTTQNRFLKNFSIVLHQKMGNGQLEIGTGFGERAPSVSEGYGFYIFNSMDLFDYVGNPYLKNEQSFEGNLKLSFQKKKLKTSLKTSFFHLHNYIIGIPESGILPMTIGASGVKTYKHLAYAHLFHSDISMEYRLSDYFKWNTQLTYSWGKDSENRNLPFISPLQYRSELMGSFKKFSPSLTLKGNAVQTAFSPFYGEKRTNDFLLVHFNLRYQFEWNAQSMQWNGGIENVTDKNYTTFTDWNNIPRMGRNVYMSLIYKF